MYEPRIPRNEHCITIARLGFLDFPREPNHRRTDVSYVCATVEGRSNLIGIAAIDPNNSGEIVLAQFADNHRFCKAVSLLQVLNAREILIASSQSERFYIRTLREIFGAANILDTEMRLFNPHDT